MGLVIRPVYPDRERMNPREKHVLPAPRSPSRNMASEADVWMERRDVGGGGYV